MAGTIWTERRAGEHTSHRRSSNGDTISVHDPSLSPDWLQMPHDPSIPQYLQGLRVRVECSCWFPLAPNPHGKDDEPDTWWTMKRTRWHVLQGVGNIAVAEVPELGWCVVDVGPERLQVLRDSKGLP